MASTSRRCFCERSRLRLRLRLRLRFDPICIDRPQRGQRTEGRGLTWLLQSLLQLDQPHAIFLARTHQSAHAPELPRSPNTQLPTRTITQTRIPHVACRPGGGGSKDLKLRRLWPRSELLSSYIRGRGWTSPLPRSRSLPWYLIRSRQQGLTSLK